MTVDKINGQTVDAALLEGSNKATVQTHAPAAHAASHKDGAADELDVSELAGAIGGAGEVPETDGAAVTWVDPDARYDPKAHAASHVPQTGGDPLSCAAPGAIDENANAEGVADYMARSDHNHQHTAALHENGGGAEISVAALSGLLADDQHVLDAEVLLVAAALLHASRHGIGGADPLRWANAKLLLGAGAGADPTLVDMPTAIYRRGEVRDGQYIPAEGDMGDPEHLNDKDTVSTAVVFPVNEYAIIYFHDIIRLTQFRFYKKVEGASNDDAEVTLQYRDPSDATWHNWVTGKIIPMDVAEWMAWDSSGGSIITDAIKVTGTKVDTGTNNLHIGELEVKY